MKVERIRDMTGEEVLQRKVEIEEELFNLKLQRSTKQLDNPLKLRTLRRDLARIETVLRENELGLRKLAQSGKKEAEVKKEEKDRG